MQYRNLFCLFSLSLLLPPAWGCRLSESPHNVYQRQGSGVVYLQPEGGEQSFVAGGEFQTPASVTQFID